MNTAEDRKGAPTRQKEGLGEHRSTEKRHRPAVYYKLGEKDHPTIIDGLRHYASIYHIALKIGCGYSTLKAYIHKHPELLAVQQEARESMSEFVESLIVRKCASGYFPALAFYAERQMGWTPHQTIENVGALPVINFGIIAESKLPPPSDDSEVKAIEAKFLRGDKEAAEANHGDKAPAPQDDGDDADVQGDDGGDDDMDAESFGVSADDDFPDGGMFG